MRGVRRLLALSLVLWASTAALAQPLRAIPDPRDQPGSWVSDGADLLGSDTEQRLNSLIQKLYAQNNGEIVIVTLRDSARAATARELAADLFSAWHIGRQGQGNGVLVLIVRRDHRVEIQTGSKAAEILADAVVDQIIREQIRPEFQAGRYGAGLLAGTESLVQRLRQVRHAPLRATSGHPFFAISAMATLFGLWLAGIALTLWLNDSTTRSRVARRLQALWLRLPGRTLQLQPEGSSRVEGWWQGLEENGRLRCANCGDRLETAAEKEVEGRLKPQERAAASLGSLRCRGWRCRRCKPDGLHLRTHVNLSDRFAPCPHCRERTMNLEPLTGSDGRPVGAGRVRILQRRCVLCGYGQKAQELVPPRWSMFNPWRRRRSDQSSDGEGMSGDISYGDQPGRGGIDGADGAAGGGGGDW